MKKHYVMLEYTTEDEEDVKSIPWGGLLQGAINCTNWKHIEQKSLKNHCELEARVIVSNEHSFAPERQAYVAMLKVQLYQAIITYLGIEQADF